MASAVTALMTPMAAEMTTMAMMAVTEDAVVTAVPVVTKMAEAESE